MKRTILFLLFIIIIAIIIPGSCITQFVPETGEDIELLVVEGLITDQFEENQVKLSKSLPLGRKKILKPLKGCYVTITDDWGAVYTLKEKVPGTYVTNPLDFRGKVGRKYRLNIDTQNQLVSGANLYESAMMEMIPVPPIDSVYYEKKYITFSEDYSEIEEGCQIYLNAVNNSDNGRFYRWDYAETWEFRLPYSVPNHVCWITENSERIDIKTTAALQENRITAYPLLFISNRSDRLKVKYSILVNQYAVTENEYRYWEKLQNVSQNVGGLYDVIPANVPSNIICLQDRDQSVLGYFSVSAKASKRIFIKDFFYGVVNLYIDCISDTVWGMANITGINSSVWVIIDRLYENPPYRVVTINKDCADCTTRGTTVEPSFWRQ